MFLLPNNFLSNLTFAFHVLFEQIHDEVALFLEEIDFTKMDLQKFTYGGNFYLYSSLVMLWGIYFYDKCMDCRMREQGRFEHLDGVILFSFVSTDLRSQMETQRGCFLTKAERRVFLQVIAR